MRIEDENDTPVPHLLGGYLLILMLVALFLLVFLPE